MSVTILNFCEKRAHSQGGMRGGIVVVKEPFAAAQFLQCFFAHAHITILKCLGKTPDSLSLASQIPYEQTIHC
jgi:hypothetical protein